MSDSEQPSRIETFLYDADGNRTEDESMVHRVTARGSDRRRRGHQAGDHADDGRMRLRHGVAHLSHPPPLPVEPW